MKVTIVLQLGEKRTFSRWTVLSIVISAWLATLFIAGPINMSAWVESVRSSNYIRNISGPLGPKLGTRLDLPKRDVSGRAIPSSKGKTLVVAGGSCSGCSLSAFAPSMVAEGMFGRVIIIYRTAPSNIPGSLTKLKPPFYVVSDVTERYLQQLETVFEPRFYLVDMNNRIVFAGQNPQDLPAGVQR